MTLVWVFLAVLAVLLVVAVVVMVLASESPEPFCPDVDDEFVGEGPW